MIVSPELRQKASNLLNSQLTAVLGTSVNNEPYSCLVNFIHTEDLKVALFATKRNRLKYRQLIKNPRVTLMVDDRRNIPDDINKTTSITLIGTAEDTKGHERDDYEQLLISRHPKLANFVRSKNTAIVKVNVDQIYMVSDFESVKRIGMSS